MSEHVHVFTYLTTDKLLTYMRIVYDGNVTSMTHI